jgi:hypothetical protein
VFVRAHTACHSTEQPLHHELAVSALLRIGQCHRELGDAVAARDAYDAALAMGHGSGDEYTVLRARAALARLAADGPAVNEDAVFVTPGP